MPIKQKNKALYPKNWPQIRAKIQARAGDKCEWCGVPNHVLIIRTHDGWDYAFQGDSGAVWIICTTAHLNHDPTDNRDENLAFLCQKCHNKHDAKHRAETRKQNLLMLDLSKKAQNENDNKGETK